MFDTRAQLDAVEEVGAAHAVAGRGVRVLLVARQDLAIEVGRERHRARTPVIDVHLLQPPALAVGVGGIARLRALERGVRRVALPPTPQDRRATHSRR